MSIATLSDVTSKGSEKKMGTHILGSSVFHDSREWIVRRQRAVVHPALLYNRLTADRNFMMKTFLLMQMAMVEFTAVIAAVETHDPFWTVLAACCFGGFLGLGVGIALYRGSWVPTDLRGLGQESIGNFVLAVGFGSPATRMLCGWLNAETDPWWYIATATAISISGMLIVKAVIPYIPDKALELLNIKRGSAPVMPEPEVSAKS